MALKLKKLSRKMPGNPEQSRWYLIQSKSGTVGLKELAREIEGRSSLSLGDVQSVLSNMVQLIPVFLKLGQTIRLEGFGSFRVTVSSEGTETPEALSARNVKGVRIVFTPGVELKNSLGEISFEVTDQARRGRHRAGGGRGVGDSSARAFSFFSPPPPIKNV
ncbi:MAG: HU family DNA-binding protein [Azoarcus sp.]|jgi:predicted histone-like DNA-binding protein|nr:HU family DNA-binding protein [Azoarcus sp.]